MKPNKYIQKIKEYPLSSHKAWEIKDKKGVLKMDWNEADMSLPKEIKTSIKKFIDKGELSWYPDVANKELLHAISSYVKIPESSIQYFEGSDVALDYILRTFLVAGDEVILASPTYDNFRLYVESIGAVPIFATPRDLFTSDLLSIEQNITPRTKAIYIVNPNNPTGVVYSRKEIEDLLKKYPDTLLILDEAYAEFSGISLADLVLKYNNLIVARSLSKAFGLASFRLGYIITNPENISFINKIRNGKNIPTLSHIAAIAALRNIKYMDSYAREVQQAKSFLVKEISKLGITAKETPANFILIKVSDPKEFAAKLASQAVFIRTLGHLPGMQHYARITVGNMKSAKKFITHIKNVLKNE